MSTDKKETRNQTDAGARQTDDLAEKDRAVDEGLDESFPGSDAPAATRRSSNEPARAPAKDKEEGDPSEQPS